MLYYAMNTLKIFKFTEIMRQIRPMGIHKYLSCNLCMKNYLNENACKQDLHLNESTSVAQYRYRSSKSGNTERADTQVYCGILTPQIRAVKFFSLTTSIGGLAAQPILLSHTSNLGVPAVVALFGFVGFFTFVTPLLLHVITKKYVTEMYFNSNNGKYTATVLNFFVRKKLITFTTNDVDVPEIPGMFTSFHVKGIPLFVEPQQFEEPAHYAKIMGYDKPLDLKLETNTSSIEKARHK